ncbi:MAG: tRNA (adenosine(37)-N6)-dimethylallyltransferase MiaA [Ignavibacteriaceae bacterium]|nr:tRNA (adenosine(37)-N6)-dimethylallyltransferase MiaA [Ignavibacteriaceae bacterium]
MSSKLITILGPTATGKTKFAVKLAHKYNGEIISADSRQVYIGMNIGTGKDLSDYKIGSKQIAYHLIDIIHPSKEFNLFRFKELFSKSFLDITSKNKIPFLVGGTGLYLSSIIQNYNLKKADFNSDRVSELNALSLDELQKHLLHLSPNVHVKKDLLSKSRMIKAILVEESKETIQEFPKINSLVLGIKMNRDEIRKRITERLKKRLEEGMIDEVKNLLNTGITYERIIAFGLEYKFIAMYLNAELSYDDMFQKLNTAIHQFAKRQMTWFRKMEREGVKINWLNGTDFEAACNLIDKNLSTV